MSPPPADLDAHRRELRRLGSYVAAVVVLAGSTYLVPQAEAVTPWLPGEPVPLVHLLERDKEVRETSQGDLVVAEREVAPAEEPKPPAEVLPRLPDRSPAIGTELELPEGALDAWFGALARAEAGEPGFVARALHWGDSTIAADGIVGSTRARLQARFGDGGPGFLAAHADPRWSIRPGVARWPKGDWETLTITFAGAEERRYGLAGTVSTATGEAKTTLGGLEIDGERQQLHRFDVYYQRQPGGGTLHAKPWGAPGRTLSTAAEKRSDAFVEIRSPGSQAIALTTSGDGPVTIYGVALETDGPGVVWDNLGVAGSGQGSMYNQGRGHLSRQIARREPHLLVYQTGGNELTYPTLTEGEGEKYQETYGKILARLRAGAPEASCLVISPLDQAERYRGAVRSKPMLDRMIDRQRDAATEAGCAFWDARHAMGGADSLSRWLAHDPPLALTDLIHLTTDGLDLVGQSLADAMELAYEDWRAAQPAGSLPAPAPPAPRPSEDAEADADAPG